MKVRKAVIPVAGFGTRFLPASKAIAKEMLTIVDRPTIQYMMKPQKLAVPTGPPHKSNRLQRLHRWLRAFRSLTSFAYLRSYQYIVEKVLASGIDQIILVTSEGKSAIGNHCDYSFGLDTLRKEKNKLGLGEEMCNISNLADQFRKHIKEVAADL